MKEEPLYFIAIMLPEAMNQEIAAFKYDMATRFHSSKALRTAAHITLKAPFKIGKEQRAELFSWFKEMMISVAPFVQDIRNFGAFSNKRNPVIFVKPVLNAALHQLQQQVLQQYGFQYPTHPISNTERHFSPHITIAYRNLQYEAFLAAWQEYSSKLYSATFIVNSFQLLQHIDGRWKVVENFMLQ